MTDGAFEDAVFAAFEKLQTDIYIAFVAPDWQRISTDRHPVSGNRTDALSAMASYGPFAADAVVIIELAAREVLASGKPLTRRTLANKMHEMREYQDNRLYSSGYQFAAGGENEVATNHMYVLDERDDGGMYWRFIE